MYVSYLQTGKGFSRTDQEFISHDFEIYGKMFVPYLGTDSFGGKWESREATGITSDFDLYGFQQGNEVNFAVFQIYNDEGEHKSGYYYVYFDQYQSGGWANTVYTRFTYSLDDGQSGGGWVMYGVDPDEFRPDYSDYRIRVILDDDTSTENTIYFSASNFTYDTTVCNSGYMWVEGANLCYVPPCYYSGSANTGYKHKIQYDTGYSGATGQTPGYIRVPDDITDKHIYYVTNNGVVRRTVESYKRANNAADSGTYNVGSSRKGHIWMTPSTYSSTEETGYNYLCYVDSSGQKRRLGTGEVT